MSPVTDVEPLISKTLNDDVPSTVKLLPTIMSSLTSKFDVIITEPVGLNNKSMSLVNTEISALVICNTPPTSNKSEYSISQPLSIDPISKLLEFGKISWVIFEAIVIVSNGLLPRKILPSTVKLFVISKLPVIDTSVFRLITLLDADKLTLLTKDSIVLSYIFKLPV